MERPTRDAEPPCRLDGQVVLADVDVVGADQRCEIGAVVDDERHAEPPGHPPGLVQHREQLLVRQLLVPDLDDVDAAADGRLEERRQVRTRRGDQVEPGS